LHGQVITIGVGGEGGGRLQFLSLRWRYKRFPTNCGSRNGKKFIFSWVDYNFEIEDVKYDSLTTAFTVVSAGNISSDCTYNEG
jgi:hypothetical protein